MFSIGKRSFSHPQASHERTAVDRRRLVATFAALAAGVVTSAAASRPASAAASSTNQELGTVWWNELQSSDIPRACAFYAQTVGWTPKVVAQEDMSRPAADGEKEYTLFTIEGREVAGAVKIDETAAPATVASWFTYIQVADVDAAVQKAVELGGKVLEPAVDVRNAGRIAVVQDPEGVRIGLITPVAG
jgi:predicted enzyme related to lactoylglutathione lyase